MPKVVSRGKQLLTRVTGTVADDVPGGLTLRTHLVDGRRLAHLYPTGRR